MARNKRDKENLLSEIDVPGESHVRVLPDFVGEVVANCGESSTSYRRNRAGTINQLDQYKNIEDAAAPYTYSENYYSATKAIELAQKSYFLFSIVKTAIDLLTDLSSSNIHLKGSTAKSKNFFYAWMDKIRVNSLIEQFFSEFYRSGNVFVNKNLGIIPDIKLKEMYQTSAAVKIPLRYVILNPRNIRLGYSTNFDTSPIYKQISPFEMMVLKNPRTEEDKAIFESLDEESKKAIKSGKGTAYIPINPELIIPVFNHKMDYEPFAVPMIWPVLADLSRKEEMKRMDAAVCRTVEKSLLLITTGEKKDQYGGGIVYKNLQKLQELFGGESVGRTLVADYTTKGEFLIPDLNRVVGQEKYRQINEDIKEGLSHILFGGEKFANSSMKIEVLLRTIIKNQQKFIDEFLYPEMLAIGNKLGLQSVPKPEFDSIDLQDKIQMSRVYTRLYELGVLTPDELYDSLQTGNLPTPAESVVAQKAHKPQIEEGLYLPKIGSSINSGGRPEGSKAPQETKNVRPIGSNGETLAELLAFAENKAKEKIGKTRLNKQQKNALAEAVGFIMDCFPSESWKSKIEQLIEEFKK